MITDTRPQLDLKSSIRICRNKSSGFESMQKLYTKGYYGRKAKNKKGHPKYN